MLEMRRKKPIPYAFVLERLAERNPFTKPMFGCTAVYIDDRIVIILRERDSFPEDNGIWLATSAEHHESLRELFPHMHSLICFGLGDKPTNWQVIPASELDFEEKAQLVCDLILRDDPRIGKVPQRKKLKTKGTKKITRGKALSSAKSRAAIKAKPAKKVVPKTPARKLVAKAPIKKSVPAKGRAKTKRATR